MLLLLQKYTEQCTPTPASVTAHQHMFLTLNEIYTNYRKSVSDDYLASHDAFNDLATTFASTWGKNIFEYDPAKNDKQELIIRANNFLQQIKKVRFLTSHCLTTWWYQGIKPQWLPVVNNLKNRLEDEDKQLTIAAHDLVAIKKWIAEVS